VEKGGREGYIKQRGMEEAPEKGKESSHSAYANGMNKHQRFCRTCNSCQGS
jgi:hypothetical protein